MADTLNNFLSISSDGASYDARLKVGTKFLQDGDRDSAVKAMAGFIRDAHLAKPLIFNVHDRSAACIEEAAEELFTEILECVAEGDAPSVTASGAVAAAPAAAVIPTRKVPADVLAVLQRGRIDGNNYYLPDEKLDRKLYDRVNEVLTAMEGKWKGGKVKAHVFANAEPEIFEDCFRELLASGSYTDPRDISYFPTPAALAKEIVAMANLQPGDRVFEPSAGGGAIALEAAKIVGLDNVECVEYFPPNVRKLRAAGLTTHEMDFIKFEPPAHDNEKFDAIIMNPPFANHQDAQHIQHACKFLKPTGRLISITSPSWQSASNSSKAEQFRDFVGSTSARVSEVPAGTFKQSGTMISTRIVSIEGKNLPWYQVDLQDTEDTSSEVAMEAPAA